MTIVEQLQEYKPFDEQERIDKEVILHFLYTNENAFLRSNTLAHMSASAFVVNSSLDKVLFAYHKIYNSWAWLGGHADGEENLSLVAMKEAREESGVGNIHLLDEAPFSIEVLPVSGHIKREQYVNTEYWDDLAPEKLEGGRQRQRGVVSTSLLPT
jgi:8-oxo-dGTP pyrophosphatase MutT (NUDIX family)